MKTAVIIGATGLIGTELVNQLSENSAYGKVVVISRRPVEFSAKKVEVLILDFDKLEQQRFSENADYFCALGTTIKQAGSQAEFRKVDYEYVYNFAKAASKSQANSFHLVSALGANSKSTNFYTKTKGLIESAVSKLDLKKVRIYRPSLLIGERGKLGQKRRLGEEIFAAVYNKAKFLFSGPLRPYEPITAKKVAQTMVKMALAESVEKNQIILNQAMH